MVTVGPGAVTVTVDVGLFHGEAAARIVKLDRAIALENIMLSRAGVGEVMRGSTWAVELQNSEKVEVFYIQTAQGSSL